MKKFALLFVMGFLGCTEYEDVTPKSCQKRAPTEYNAGISAATIDNKADYDRGFANGNSLSYEDGMSDGKHFAYNNGYNSPNGYPKGYGEQYPVGYAIGKADSSAVINGINDGIAHGEADGKEDGRKDGWRVGENDGRLLGDSEGAEDGYANGYEAGQWNAYDDPAGVCGITPAARKKKKLPKNFASDCEALGYSKTRDSAGNYTEGYVAGQAANVEYNKGYNDYKNDPASYAEGLAKGYIDGRFNGYHNGFRDGYQYTYDIAYTPTYNNAYESAYDHWYAIEYVLGFDYGYVNAYDDAYDEMYAQGFTDGEDDYCAEYEDSINGRKSGGSYRKSKGYVSLRAKHSMVKLETLKDRKQMSRAQKKVKLDVAKLKKMRTEQKSESRDRMLREKIRETGDRKFVELMNNMESELGLEGIL